LPKKKRKKKMPRFNLEDYETVEERIKRFYAAHPDGRIVTHNLTEMHDRSVSTWIVRAEIYESYEQQVERCPKASGLAFEVDGGAGANQTSALENAETSAIGRALANAGFSGNKRASREEMKKVDRATRDWISDANKLDDVDALRLLWAEAKAAGAPKLTLDKVAARAKSLADTAGKPGGSQ
jgi:hypothetical protein